jgi:hypothetical protein
MRLPRQNAVSRQGLVICLVLAALLLARFAPATSSQLQSPRSTTSSLSVHPHRTCVDRETTDWANPGNSFALAPQLFISAALKPALDLQIPFSTKGSHYNRPPPLV